MKNVYKAKIIHWSFHCPECGEHWTEEDLENIGDIGCPSCKKIFDAEDFTGDDNYAE